MTPAETVAYGWLVHDRAASARWPASVRETAAPHASALRDALETYEGIRDDVIHPASEYDDLAGEPEDKHKALERAAEAVADLTAELVRVFPACAVSARGRAA